MTFPDTDREEGPARDRDGALEIAHRDLLGHCLSGPFFILKNAQARVQAQGLDSILRWFNLPREAVLVGDFLPIDNTGLFAFFGYDREKPNRHCFYVDILASTDLLQSDPLRSTSHADASLAPEGAVQ